MVHSRALEMAARFVLLLVLLWVPSCAKCSREGEPKPTASSKYPPELLAKVLVRVGGEPITVADYIAALEHMDPFDRLRYQAPERRKELLKELIDLKLLAAEARARGYDKDALYQMEYRAVLRDAMRLELRKGLPTPEDIPESEVREYYRSHASEFRDPERRRVAAVVLRSQADAEAALKLAKSASAPLWGELVRTKSVDPSPPDVPVDLAGDLGMVSPPGDPRGENARVPLEVRAAVFELGRVGDVVPRVIAASGKYYVVRLMQKNEARGRSYEEAERAIRLRLSQDKVRAREDETLKALRERYPVVIHEEALASVSLPDGGLRAR